MKLFWKQDKNSSKKTPETEQMSVDKIAKEKYEEKTGSEMSPEVEGMFRKLAKAEFNLQRTKQEVLTEASMKHILEVQQLLRTKLANVEKETEDTLHHLQWFDAYDRLIKQVEKTTADKCKILQEYTKQESDRQAVDRFDQFEKVHGLFQKILIMTDTLAQTQQEQGAKHKMSQELQETVNQLRNQYIDKEKMVATTDQEIRAVQQRMNEGLELLGEINACELRIEALAENLNRLEEDRKTLNKSQQEVEQRRGEMMRKREQATQDQQVLLPHRYVLENVSMMQVKLNRLEVLRRRCESAQNEFDRKQREYEVNNIALNNLFRKDQDLKSELSNLTQKLSIHKESVHGQDLNRIQKRAFDLALQQNMLRRASFVWARICRCYDFVEEKTQELNRTRLHYQTEERKLRTTEICLHAEQESGCIAAATGPAGRMQLFGVWCYPSPLSLGDRTGFGHTAKGPGTRLRGGTGTAQAEGEDALRIGGAARTRTRRDGAVGTGTAERTCPTGRGQGAVERLRLLGRGLCRLFGIGEPRCPHHHAASVARQHHPTGRGGTQEYGELYVPPGQHKPVERTNQRTGSQTRREPCGSQ
jgi:hypothetical protein